MLSSIVFNGPTPRNNQMDNFRFCKILNIYCELSIGKAAYGFSD